MSETMSATETESADDQPEGSVVEELTADFNDMYFAEQFNEGERVYFRLGSEKAIATVAGTEPADGTFLLDVSNFDCGERIVMLPDRSSTGPEMSNLDCGWALIAVPIDHELVREAGGDGDTDFVVCDCGAVNKAGRGHSVHVGHQHSEESADDSDDLPDPRDDPVLKYVHEGKQYRILGGRTFTVVEYLPDVRPDVDGLVVIEADDGNQLLSEHRRDRAGVSREVLAGHIPEERHRAVYTATGILASLRELEIGEVDPNSYVDLYWERQNE